MAVPVDLSDALDGTDVVPDAVPDGEADVPSDAPVPDGPVPDGYVGYEDWLAKSSPEEPESPSPEATARQAEIV